MDSTKDARSTLPVIKAMIEKYEEMLENHEEILEQLDPSKLRGIAELLNSSLKGAEFMKARESGGSLELLFKGNKHLFELALEYDEDDPVGFIIYLVDSDLAEPGQNQITLFPLDENWGGWDYDPLYKYIESWGFKPEDFGITKEEKEK